MNWWRSQDFWDSVFEGIGRIVAAVALLYAMNFLLKLF